MFVATPAFKGWAIHERLSRVKCALRARSSFSALFLYASSSSFATDGGCSCTGIDPVRTSYPFVLAMPGVDGTFAFFDAQQRRHVIQSGAGGPFILRPDVDCSSPVKAQSD